MCVKPNLRTRRVCFLKYQWHCHFCSYLRFVFPPAIFHPVLLFSRSLSPTYEFAAESLEENDDGLIPFLLNNGFHLKSPRK